MPTDVTVSTFIRAETDAAVKNIHGMTGGFSSWIHLREPTPLDMQKVIRMNRDTLYSSAVLDLSESATVIMPEIGGRYQSLQILDQDHYSVAHTSPGRYELTEDIVGTRYAYLIVRTFYDANNPADLVLANAAQDAMEIEGGGSGPLDLPNWNTEQMMIARDALNTLAKLGLGNEGAFGTREQVNPITHLIFTAAGWGGLPNQNTMAVLGSVPNNDGSPHVLTAKNVPVRAFWSVIVYDTDGFIPENDLGLYSYNNVTASPNPDGSITIHFGGDPDQVNYLPIAPGWNYVVRMYEPGQEVIDGTWTFPEVVPAG